MVDKVVNPESLADPLQFLYSQAAVKNGTLYISGQLGIGEEYVPVGESMEEQARQSLSNIETILDEVDKDFDDIGKVTAYVVDIQENLDEFIEVWGEFFDEPYPAHTAIGVDELAVEGCLIEIETEVSVEE